MADRKEVLEYLQVWRTRKNLEAKFGLSNTESYHLLKWMKKTKEVTEYRVRRDMNNEKNVQMLKECGAGKTNFVWVYRAIK